MEGLTQLLCIRGKGVDSRSDYVGHSTSSDCCAGVWLGWNRYLVWSTFLVFLRKKGNDEEEYVQKIKCHQSGIGSPPCQL